MDGCPYCVQMKDKLKESNIDFLERDIFEHNDEYEMFVEVTQNDFVPAFMIIENPDKDNEKSFLFAPDRDYEDIEDGVSIIKEHFKK
jgi:glutaredoxin-related protein